MSFKFVQHEDDMLYNPSKQLTKFYQICKFPISDKQHTVRTVVVNEVGVLVESKEKNHKASSIKKFIEKNATTRYKIYATHNMNIIPLPEAADILTAKSPLLNDMGYSGYAPI